MGTKTKALAALTLGAVLALALAATGLATGAQTEPVSVSSSGEKGNDDSYGPAISANGRYVAFYSGATNLVPGDTNGESDVFVRDRELGTTQRISVSSAGRQGNGHSYEPAISANGRYVAFTSKASTLVPRDTNGAKDVFVRDRKLHTTRRVSVSSAGRRGHGDEPAISADGRFVAFASGSPHLVHRDTNGDSDVFVRDLKRDTTRRVSVSSTGRQAKGNGYVPRPAISGNGRYVAFQSDATNLVPQETSRDGAVFVRDRKLHKTRLVSVSSTGHPANQMSLEPAISADGRFVAFWSVATNLVPGDRGYNGYPDVFVRDLKRHTTTIASVLANGKNKATETRPAISADGRYVAFQSHLDGICVRDRKLHTTETVNGGGGAPAISADGRYVAFTLDSPLAGHYVSDVFARGPLR
jgi:Tol biopolymer transport system component